MQNSDSERRDYAVMLGREVWSSARGASRVSVGGPPGSLQVRPRAETSSPS
jgi:hypothetical protein